MPINFQRQAMRASLLLCCTLSLSLAIGWTASSAAEALTAVTTQKSNSSSNPIASNGDWKKITPLKQNPLVRVWSIGPRKEPTYVITHGMGGTSDGDRFHKLANAISKTFPNACVLRVDWSERASATKYGLPDLCTVAASIDEVGDQAALLLQQEQIDPQRTIFIGESFGNWVNARIAHKLGGVQGILAMNPANESSGYTPPDLRKHAKHSWSFHTYSMFDTTNEIAESDFWLETPARVGHWEQHVAGIHWLSARLEAGDNSWLHMDKSLPQRRSGHFQALVTMDGLLSEEQLPRVRPVSTQATNIYENSPAREIAVAAK